MRALRLVAALAPSVMFPVVADSGACHARKSEEIANTRANAFLQMVAARGVSRAIEGDAASEFVDAAGPNDEAIDSRSRSKPSFAQAGVLGSKSDRLLNHGVYRAHRQRADDGRSSEKRSARHKKMISRLRQMQRIVRDVENALGLGKESAKSLHPHSPHAGTSPDIPFPYEIREVAGGMGLFAKKPLAKGAVTWRFNPKDHIAIYEQDLPILRRLLRTKDPSVAVWLTRWTYAWADYCSDKCVLYEMDDGRYMNDGGSSKSNQVSDSSGYTMISKKAIPADSEILDDYDEDGVDDAPAWWETFCRE